MKKLVFYLLLIILYNQILSQTNGQISEDISACQANKDTNTCSNVQLKSGIYQCCKVKYFIYTNTYYGPSSTNVNICSVQVKPIKTFNDEMSRDTTKALYKEIWGYVVYNVVTGAANSKQEMTFECADGTGTMRFGYDTYTNEEEEILKSDNHCMSYFYGLNEFNSKEDCFNGEILPSSKKVGLSCGYYEVSIKYSDGTSQTIKSCNIFNKDIINSKHLDDKSKETFESFVKSNKNNDKVVISYVAELSDDQGHTIVYDSLTQSININNNSEKISLVKYLLYISLLLIL